MKVSAPGLGVSWQRRIRDLWLERVRGPARLTVAAGLGRATALARKALRREDVTIVVYHDPPPAALDLHLGWYRSQGYRFVALRDYLAAAQRRDASALPPQSLVVTIDDGWRGNIDLLPVLRRHRCPATLFACAAPGTASSRNSIARKVLSRRRVISSPLCQSPPPAWRPAAPLSIGKPGGALTRR